MGPPGRRSKKEEAGGPGGDVPRAGRESTKAEAHQAGQARARVCTQLESSTVTRHSAGANQIPPRRLAFLERSYVCASSAFLSRGIRPRCACAVACMCPVPATFDTHDDVKCKIKQYNRFASYL